jgi:hypothetical protein
VIGAALHRTTAASGRPTFHEAVQAATTRQRDPLSAARPSPSPPAPENADNLDPLLAAIAEDVQHTLALQRSSITAEFSNRLHHARRHAPRHELAAIVVALRQAKRAALTAAAQHAAAALLGRRRTAITERAGRRQRRPSQATDPPAIPSLR